MFLWKPSVRDAAVAELTARTQSEEAEPVLMATLSMLRGSQRWLPIGRSRKTQTTMCIITCFHCVDDTSGNALLPRKVYAEQYGGS